MSLDSTRLLEDVKILPIDVNIADAGFLDCTDDHRVYQNVSIGINKRIKELVVGYMMLEDARQGDTLQRG